MHIRLLALASLLTMSAGGALIAASAAAPAASAYPMCAFVSGSGIRPISPIGTCVGQFGGTLCDTETVIAPETVTVSVCIPDGLVTDPS